jgi:hypothetical protein
VSLTPRENAEHWGDYLMGYRWTLFATLTTRYPLTEARLVSAFDVWMRKLARVAQGPPAWQRSIEPHACGNHLHIHCLVWVPPCVIPSTAKGLWRLGRADVERFDPNRGAAYYIGKTYLSAPDSYDVSRRQPPLAVTGTQRFVLP